MIDLTKMRGDYADAVRWFRFADGWTDADVAELGAAVKVATHTGTDLDCWAAWLANVGQQWRDWVAAVRETEDRAREMARAANAAALGERRQHEDKRLHG